MKSVVDAGFDAWLRSLLTHMDLRWEAYRKKRKTVRKRLEARGRHLGLPSWEDYAGYLVDHPEEEIHLREALAITVSCFFREPPLFAYLTDKVFPKLADRRTERLTAWSAGCASGQEAYTLAILWEVFRKTRSGLPPLDIIATDIDSASLKRAREGVFRKSELERVPEDLLATFFLREGDSYCVKPEIQTCVRFSRHDLLQNTYPTPVHLLLCRWSAFFYFEERLKSRILSGFSTCLKAGDYLVIGKREDLPPEWPRNFILAEGRKDVYIRKPMA
jgi:chemotaxis methyl-accepting protein methylase